MSCRTWFVCACFVSPFLVGQASAVIAKPVPQEKRNFDNPRVGGLAVDRCLTWGQQCNGEAAHAFCRMQGYEGAADWSWAYMKPTRLLGSPGMSQICNLAQANGCGGITRVVCAKAKVVGGGGLQPPVQGGANIMARLEAIGKCQFRPGPNRSKHSHYVCRITYSLTNSGSEAIIYTHGTAARQHMWNAGQQIVDGIGYGRAHNPGTKLKLGTDCVVPHGMSTGLVSLSGMGKDRHGRVYKWALNVKCP